MEKSFLNRYFYIILFSLIVLFVLMISAIKKDEKIPITTSSKEAMQDFIKGRDLFEKIKTHEAMKYLENAIDKDKDFALAYYYHAIANPTNKGFFEDLTKAVALSDKVSKGEKLMIMALKNGADGDTKMQEENLTKLVKEYPDDERAHNLLGGFYYGLQMYDKAIEHLKKATEIAPEYSASYNMLGYAYSNTKNYPEAETAFKKYIELIPDDPNPYDSYAELLLKEGKYQESIDQYRKALSVDPNFHNSYYGISTDYTYLRKYDEARKELTTFYENARNDGEKRAALYGMTVSFADEGKLDQALEQMQKQYELGEKINDVAAMVGDLNTIGNILYEQGKYDEAMKKFDEANKLTMSSSLPDKAKENFSNLNLYNTARVLLMKNDLEGAKKNSSEFADKANKMKNTFQVWASHQLQGQIALNEKDYKKALSEFNMANKQDPYTFYYIGLVYHGMGDVEKAKQNFKTASALNNLNNINQAFVRVKTGKMFAEK